MAQVEKTLITIPYSIYLGEMSRRKTCSAMDSFAASLLQKHIEADIEKYEPAQNVQDEKNRYEYQIIEDGNIEITHTRQTQSANGNLATIRTNTIPQERIARIWSPFSKEFAISFYICFCDNGNFECKVQSDAPDENHIQFSGLRAKCFPPQIRGRVDVWKNSAPLLRELRLGKCSVSEHILLSITDESGKIPSEEIFSQLLSRLEKADVEVVLIEGCKDCILLPIPEAVVRFISLKSFSDSHREYWRSIERKVDVAFTKVKLRYKVILP